MSRNTTAQQLPIEKLTAPRRIALVVNVVLALMYVLDYIFRTIPIFYKYVELPHDEYHFPIGWYYFAINLLIEFAPIAFALLKFKKNKWILQRFTFGVGVLFAYITTGILEFVIGECSPWGTGVLGF